MVSPTQPYSIAEYEALIDEAENSDRLLELVHGLIVEKMPTQLHAAIVHLISGFLFIFLREHPIGWALVQARYQLPGDEHNARIPDLSFVRRVEGRTLTTARAAPYMPDLAIEIQSPGQSDRMMLDKADYYLSNGTQMVWLVYPDRRLVEVLTNDERHLLTETGAINGRDVLPGFTVNVKDIFPSEVTVT
jgi:Uma2 family endonuclease